jgi:hypothetical protein
MPNDVPDGWLRLARGVRLIRIMISSRGKLCIHGFIGAFAAACALGATGQESETLCLYSLTDSNGKLCKESGDPKHLSQDPDIRQLIVTLGLDKANIKFVGCEDGRFATTDTINPISSAHMYRISYPLLKEDAFAQNGGETHSPYVAPITHELSHVLQIEVHGSIAEMKNENARKSRSIELAADFISGIAFARTGTANLNAFQQNLSLVGLYKEDELQAHGTWGQRTYAFRRGVYLKPNPAPINIRDADAMFVGGIYQEVLGADPTRQANAATAATETLWNKLSACGEVKELYQQLRGAAKPIAACRGPDGALERAMNGRFKKHAQVPLCFLSTAPAAHLEGFSCFQPPEVKGGALTCMRPADKAIIIDHYNDKHTSEGATYMRSASACGANVDASVALPSLFSPLLAEISRPEFGYVRSLGTESRQTGQMQHGFASVDPDLSLKGIEAIEYVTLFTDGAPLPTDRSKEIGKWELTVDDNAPLEKEFNRQLKQRGIPILVDFTTLNIRRKSHSGAADSSKPEQVRTWQKLVGQSFKDEGFKKIPESKLRTADGKDIHTVMNDLKALVPYGFREFGFLGEISPSAIALLKETGPRCTDDQQGAFGAFVFATAFGQTRPLDYGSIDLFVMGAGECGKQSTDAKRYMTELRENATETILTTLEGDK